MTGWSLGLVVVYMYALMVGFICGTVAREYIGCQDMTQECKR